MSVKTYLVGRNPNVSQGEIAININDPSKRVSSNHCRITFDGTNFYIEDLISVNGTYVNGKKITNRTIIDFNSIITLGKNFNFSLQHYIQLPQQRQQINHSSEVSQALVKDKPTKQNNLYISNSIANKLPSMVRNELAKMPAIKQEEYIEEYKRNIKSLGIAYLFMFFILGMHYGYIKKWGLQFVFWLTGGGFIIWFLIDIFRLPSIIRDYNKDKAIETMRNLKATAQ